MARITEDWVKRQVVAEQFHLFPGTMVTVCVLTLKNGFNTVGSSACADPAVFNEEIGLTTAYKDALSKVWLLEGYRLKQKIAYGKDVAEYPV